MTNEEAISLIQTAKAEIEWEYPMEYAEAFEQAINALEKQVPKPVHYDGYINDTVCPCCGVPLVLDLETNAHADYCDSCGQRLA